MIIKFENTKLSIFNPIFIIPLSVFACLFVLWVERTLGIEWDFHPDAKTYLDHSYGTASNFMTSGLAFGHSFYIIVDLFNSEIWQIITFNIITYSLTNMILANYIQKNFKPINIIISFLLLFIIFNPYRIHLTAYVLKDTLLVFLVVCFFTIKKIHSWAYVIVATSLSLRVFVYLLSLINGRNLLFIITPIILYYSVHKNLFYFQLFEGSQINMSFRSFDMVPSFYQYGFLGSLMRALTWPFLYLTGTFLLISPSIFYVPLAISSLVLQYWSWVSYKKLSFYLPIYITLGIFAFLAPGFTSFMRYGLPLLTIFPIILIEIHNRKNQNSSKMEKNNAR